MSFSDGHGSKLAVVGLGQKPIVLARKPVLLPSWSPDSRLVTVLVNARVRAYRATGGVAWSVRVTDGFFHGWSARGLFLMILHAQVRVYDVRGRLRLASPAAPRSGRLTERASRAWPAVASR